MKILIVTQAVDADSSTMGFFVEWLREFARQCEEVCVIGLAVGRHDLPANVRVLSMGKERGAGRPARLLNFWKHLRASLPAADGVFIHMCPEYLIAGWPFIAASRKPVMLWYAHKKVNPRMLLAARLADAVLTSSSYAFKAKGVVPLVVGQGIPTDFFKPISVQKIPAGLIAVGRVTRIKRIELMIRSLRVLHDQGVIARLDIYGEPVMPDDLRYKVSLEELARELRLTAHVRFMGSVAYQALPVTYNAYAVALNAAPTGAPDKAVLEPLACGIPAVVTNRAFKGILAKDDFLVADEDPQAYASAIIQAMRVDASLSARVRSIIVSQHSLGRLIERVLESYPSKRS